MAVSRRFQVDRTAQERVGLFPKNIATIMPGWRDVSARPLLAALTGLVT
ncbi:hypothetical protein G3A43_01335 [Paraburkholderia aspalathi]|nr:MULTISPECIES: hypothetical protein [Paraburkholderia]MBK3778881.1 hypothetical protein [Paraburkholderia aspalathi]